jgi:hypothetical protein
MNYIRLSEYSVNRSRIQGAKTWPRQNTSRKL